MRTLPGLLLTALGCAGLACLPSCETLRAPQAQPQDAFLERLARYEGWAFEGRIVANEPAPAGDPFEGQRLVMHVRRVAPGRIEIPFHVGDDHSRTWVLTRTPQGLRLEHDHRKRDGREDELTRYGGHTAGPGSARRQEFPVNAYSQALFDYLGYHASLTNVWAMEIEPERAFVYELARPGRIFRVEFDLARPVPPPPTPWGY